MVMQDQVEGPRRRNGNDEALKFSKVPNIRVKVGWLMSIMLYFVSNKEAASVLATFVGWLLGIALSALAIYAAFKLIGPIRDWMRNRQAERANRAAKESLEIERLKAELAEARSVKQVEVPATPPTNPVVPSQTPLCPCPTDDERDQVDRSQDARLNRLEAQREADKQEIMAALNKLAERPVVEAQPVYRTTRKPAKR